MIVYDPPEEGQFVVIWEYNNNIWSGVYKIEDDKWFVFSDEMDNFVSTKPPSEWNVEITNIRYIIM